MFRTIISTVLTLLLCLPTRASEIEHVEVTHEGVSVRASIAPAGARLAHTCQVFAVDDAGKNVGGADVAAQTEQVLKNLDAALKRANASLENAVRINLYVATPEAAVEARRVVAERAKCAVSAVISTLSKPGALVAADAVAVAGEGKDAPANDSMVRVLKSDRAAYISGMAADGSMADATRRTLEQLDDVLRQLGASRDDVVHVKSFLRGAEDVSVSQSEFTKFFGEAAPPATWVEWTMKGSIEIEMIAQLPAKPDAAAGDAENVSYYTPAGVKPSPVYSKVALVQGGQMIYTSGVAAGAATKDAAGETRLALAALREVIQKAGGDFEHLVKATYYPASDATGAALNQIRPEFYNPKRPPAASKAPVRGAVDAGSKLTMDLIGVKAKS